MYLNRPTFEDEFSPELKHTGAGILSMANRYSRSCNTRRTTVSSMIILLSSFLLYSGPNTNGSQFFVSLGPAQWLDGELCHTERLVLVLDAG